jgi:meiotically up-regulated gene 157 (Mug157) protein
MTDWDFKSGRTIHVAMHNYEIDSLCYFIKLSYDYWKATGSPTHMGCSFAVVN